MSAVWELSMPDKTVGDRGAQKHVGEKKWGKGQDREGRLSTKATFNIWLTLDDDGSPPLTPRKGGLGPGVGGPIDTLGAMVG